MKRLLSLLLMLPFLALAQVTTNPSVTGVPAPQSAVAITGGTIDGTPIGGTTPAAGAFTSLSASTTLGVTGTSTMGIINASDTLSVGDAGGGVTLSWSGASGIINTKVANNNLIIRANGSPGITISSAQAVAFPAVTTGTNANFVCMASGNILTLQSSACTISSKRFKENIQPMKGSALAKIERLHPVAFNMSESIGHNPDTNAYKRQIGLLAENVAAVDRKMAIYEQDGKTPKSYRQESVIALLVKGIQEQQKQINELKREIREARALRVTYH